MLQAICTSPCIKFIAFDVDSLFVFTLLLSLFILSLYSNKETPSKDYIREFKYPTFLPSSKKTLFVSRSALPKRRTICLTHASKQASSPQ
jgi:hypothetical protein